ncbi:MAG: hypothetical protein AAFZ01_06355 [Pseudomonadota bacterium]
MEKVSCLEVAPFGGRGNGDERLTAASAARSSAALPLRRAIRA